MEFTLKQIKKGEVRILVLNGCLGNDEFCRVDEALALLLEQKHGCVVLDLKTLSFATARSLAQFLVCGREFRRHGGELKLVGLSHELSRLAEMAGFNAVNDFEPDMATALTKMSTMGQAMPRQPRKMKK
jgi:anti-anti-sigma factor